MQWLSLPARWLQYGNLGFFKDKRYSHAVVLYREDTKVAVLATWKEGIQTTSLASRS